MKQICFLGMGNMGSALLKGAVQAKFIQPRQVTVFDIDAQRLQQVRKSKVRVAKSSSQAIRNADFVFLCVKPQQMQAMLQELAPAASKSTCFVSIAAGIATSLVERTLGGKVAVVRVMPNTPALMQCGMSAIAPGKFAQKTQVQFVKKFLDSVGQTVVLKEKDLDAVTAVSGSGPAYVFYLAELLEQAAVQLNLSPGVARQLSVQTFLGAAKMLAGKDVAAQLRAKVTSPNGTTEAAIRYLQAQSWPQQFVQAVQKACVRSQELSRSL